MYFKGIKLNTFCLKIYLRKIYTSVQKPGLKSLGLHTSAENAITQTFSKKLASKLQAISTFKLLQAGEICSNTDSRLVISAHEVQVKRILENLLVQVAACFSLL